MTTKMESGMLSEWIVFIPDIEGSFETRMRVRETHIKDMIKHIDSGLFQMGGATLDGQSIDGSAIIARARTEAEILDILKSDVYARSGVWDLDRARFIPFKCVYRRAHVDGKMMGDLWKY
ncbi:hypothetical protein ACJZ2D_003445 [Fusarium nematophilum]